MGWLVEVHCATQGAPFLLEIGRWNYRNNFGSIWVSLAMPCNMGFENDASWCIKTPGQRSCKRSRCEPQILGFQAAEKNGIGPFGLAKQAESSHMLTLYLQKAGHEFATCTIQIWIHVYTCVWFMIVYVFHVCFMSGLCVITWYWVWTNPGPFELFTNPAVPGIHELWWCHLRTFRLYHVFVEVPPCTSYIDII